MNSFITLKYIKEIKMKFPNNFNDLIEDISNQFKIDQNELITLQFIFNITNGEKMIIEINDEEKYQYFKNLYENNCESIEVNIRNYNFKTNSEYRNEINEEINQIRSTLYKQEKNINDLKNNVENNQNLDKIVNLNKKMEAYNTLLVSQEKEKKKKSDLFFSSINETIDNNILSCEYIENEKLIRTKSTILKNYVIEHNILIKNTSKNNNEWPIDTFLRCVNDDSDIYFYHINDRIKKTQKEGVENIYIFQILVLFKNHKNIKEGEYELKYQLINDFYGVIGDDYGNLIIKVIE